MPNCAAQDIAHSSLKPCENRQLKKIKMSQILSASRKNCVLVMKATTREKIKRGAQSKIHQTKIFVICQRFDDLFLFGLAWQFSKNQNQYNKGRFKVMAKYLLAAVI